MIRFGQFSDQICITEKYLKSQLTTTLNFVIVLQSSVVANNFKELNYQLLLYSSGNTQN